MTEIIKSALVGYSARKMFELINDISSYPEYMTGVKKVEILTQTETCIEARLVVAKGRLQQTFATRNTLTSPSLMQMDLIEGPFKTFSGSWQFKALAEDACKVTLALQFEFNNRLLALAAGPMFESLSGQQVDALCARAEKIYG